MKKSEFKKLIKPIVSECIKESLMEGGLISNIIAEVVKGMSTSSPLVETVQPPTPPAVPDPVQKSAFSKKQKNKLHEHRSKLMDAIGKEAYNGVNLFEGTTPAPDQQQANPLSGQESTDAGVDISNLLGAVKTNWTAHMNEVKERK